MKWKGLSACQCNLNSSALCLHPIRAKNKTLAKAIAKAIAKRNCCSSHFWPGSENLSNLLKSKRKNSISAAI